jgi:hypothetical protein
MTDPSAVGTLAELAAALDELRLQRGLSYGDLEKAARRNDKEKELSTSTVHDMLRRHSITEEKLRIFLDACKVGEAEVPAWIDARRRVRSGTPSSGTRDFFRHLIASHTALFAGRDAESRQILDFVRNRRTGYVFVEGRSGYGKTSLLAHLVGQHQEFCYHFISQAYKRSGSGFDPTQPADLLENLCEQLNPGHAQRDSIRALEQEFLSLLSKPPRKPTVIVLDAIDELNPQDQLRALLPLRLPTGLVVILSARTQGDRSPLHDVGLSIAQMSLHLRLLGLDETALVELLDLAGGAACPLAKDDDFVAELHAVSEGDPFYLRFLAEDVASGALTRESVNQAPSGLEPYLDLQLEMLERSSHRPQHVEILGFLLHAKVLSRADLLNMVKGLTWLNFDAVLCEIHRFLLVYDCQYSFCHDRFREYFMKKAAIG